MTKRPNYGLFDRTNYEFHKHSLATAAQELVPSSIDWLRPPPKPDSVRRAHSRYRTEAVATRLQCNTGQAKAEKAETSLPPESEGRLTPRVSGATYFVHLIAHFDRLDMSHLHTI